MLADVPISEHLLIDREIFRHIDDNRLFREEVKDFRFPPIPLMVDAHSTWSYREYHRGGQKAARIISDIIQRHHRNAASIYEWGCGPGRVIRHLPSEEFLGKKRRYFGSDYNGASVEWCMQNLPGIGFQHNASLPPLPYPNDAFDVTYCRSVFTHLSERSARLWMDELRRVTKSGGLISFTTHGDHMLPKLSEDEAVLYRSGSYVERAEDSEGLRSFAAFHPPSFVRDSLAFGLEVAEHRTDLGHQDVWVVRVS